MYLEVFDRANRPCGGKGKPANTVIYGDHAYRLCWECTEAAFEQASGMLTIVPISDFPIAPPSTLPQ